MHKDLTVPLTEMAEEMMRKNENLTSDDMGDLFSMGYSTPYGEIFAVENGYDDIYYYMDVDSPTVLKLTGQEIIDKAHQEFLRVCEERIKENEEEAEE